VAEFELFDEASGDCAAILPVGVADDRFTFVQFIKLTDGDNRSLALSVSALSGPSEASPHPESKTTLGPGKASFHDAIKTTFEEQSLSAAAAFAEQEV
jgi:hypothetical protein